MAVVCARQFSLAEGINVPSKAVGKVRGLSVVYRVAYGG